ncbi:hypothetical protein V9J15_04045 [Candidatus Liberibacter africanus]|uniref:hypothetical protein n=1 Tax=Liberibacter africanus TaxID=34020 RepID=UPI00339D4C79
MINSDNSFADIELTHNQLQTKPWNFANNSSQILQGINKELDDTIISKNDHEHVSYPRKDKRIYGSDRLNQKQQEKNIRYSVDTDEFDKNDVDEKVNLQLENQLKTEIKQENSHENSQNINDLNEISLDNGEKITISELKDGYSRHKEYLSQQQDIWGQKKNVQNQAQILAHSSKALAQLINHHIPDEPDPILEKTDSETYHRIRNLRKNALDIINHFVEAGRNPDNLAKELGSEIIEKKLEDENQKLENIFPQTKDPAQRQDFFKNVFKIGNILGFQEEEMKNIADHRLLSLAYYAQIGWKAQKLSEDAYHKIRHKPAVNITNKARNNNHHRIVSQEKAIQKLSQTGSFEDALAVDFL